MDELREKIAAIVMEVAGDETGGIDYGYAMLEQSEALTFADRILAIPEIAEALRVLDSYGRDEWMKQKLGHSISTNPPTAPPQADEG